MSVYTDAARNLSGDKNPQTEVIPGRESDMARNNAGGYSFLVDHWTQLERFLIQGSEGGTYYVEEQKLTIENVKGTLKCIELDGLRVVETIVAISQQGRALKNTPALFALALCASHRAKDKAPKREQTDEYISYSTAAQVRAAAYDALPKVARTGTHLFQFNNILDELKHGWGMGRRKAVSAWYNDKNTNDLVYQVLKYRERENLSHKRLLSTAHPKATSEDHNVVFNWIQKGGWETVGNDPHPNPDLGRLWAFERAKRAKTIDEVVKLVREYGLTQEMVPTNWHGDAKLWEALVERMPMTALIRNLGRLTANGVISPMSDTTRKVVEQITDAEWLRKARVHPMSILIALKTYAMGRGVKGSLTWTPVSKITDALDTGFYASFGTITPTNKKVVLALDVSGSMSAMAQGCPNLSCYEAESAMALITYATEPNCQIIAFSDQMKDLPISSKMRLDDVLKIVQGTSMGGGTDCALPMMWARGYDTNKVGFRAQLSSGWHRTTVKTPETGYTKVRKNVIDADAFVVYTDNETYYGAIHPSQALKEYRQESGNAAKLIVAAMAPSKFSIADPADGGMLDISGMDASVPQLITDFIAA